MKRTVLADPYFYNQPPMDFTDDLKKPLHEKVPSCYGKRKIEEGEHYFCLSSERSREYLREAGKTLLELAPKLKGFISITYGERSTTCASPIMGKSLCDAVQERLTLILKR